MQDQFYARNGLPKVKLSTFSYDSNSYYIPTANAATFPSQDHFTKNKQKLFSSLQKEDYYLDPSPFK
jgi:hypothetical protein